jgi:glycosyltransferase involved in cell wall biosynthesis
MHILLVNNTVIPVQAYGGTERVIWWLGKYLVRLGHKVTYLVAPGSSCPFADVIDLDPAKTLNEQVPATVDVVHLHIPTREKFSKPYMFTYHGNYPEDNEFPINTVFVSRNHAERYSARAFVYNGIDPEDYGPVDFNGPREHLLFLGYAKRPDKNLKDCLKIARRTRNVLAVVGGKPKWFKWRPWVSYKGFLGGSTKNAALQKSKGLLFPVRWHEPFGLAVIESLYFGAPVFGTPYGSLPELVNPEVGFLSLSRRELVKAVASIDLFNRQKCHDYICERFTAKQMAESYIELYKKVLSGQPLNPCPPVNHKDNIPNALLPIYD